MGKVELYEYGVLELSAQSTLVIVGDVKFVSLNEIKWIPSSTATAILDPSELRAIPPPNPWLNKSNSCKFWL